MDRVHGRTLLMGKNAHPVDLADVLRDGRLALPRSSLEDHQRLNLLKVAI